MKKVPRHSLVITGTKNSDLHCYRAAMAERRPWSAVHRIDFAPRFCRQLRQFDYRSLATRNPCARKSSPAGKNFKNIVFAVHRKLRVPNLLLENDVDQKRRYRRRF